jgi:hypothetical protein
MIGDWGLAIGDWLSNCYRDIRLFRFDDQTGDVYILAGDDMKIIVPFDGAWYFL